VTSHSLLDDVILKYCEIKQKIDEHNRNDPDLIAGS